jgi:hypothetical protein
MQESYAFAGFDLKSRQMWVIEYPSTRIPDDQRESLSRKWSSKKQAPE